MHSTRLLAATALSFALAVGCAPEEVGEDELTETTQDLYWDTKCMDPADYQPVNGDLHSHSTVSDGNVSCGTLADTQNQANADFTLVTDHGGGFGPIKSETAAQGDPNWERCRDTLIAKSTNGFLARAGVEASVDHKLNADNDREDPSEYKHHALVLFPPHLRTGEYAFWANGPGGKNFETRLDWVRDLEKCEECVGGFAHPATDNSGGGNALTPWMPRKMTAANFNRVDFVELNGEFGEGPAISKYLEFLNHGFKVSPVYDSDTHGNYPGNESQFGAGAWVNAWGAGVDKEAELRNALRNQRTFAVYPGLSKRTIRLVLVREAGNCLMGSTVRASGHIHLRVVASGTDWDAVKLYTNGHGEASPLRRGTAANGVCRKSNADNTTTCEFRDVATDGRRYFVAHADRNGGWAVTAPIWVK